MVRSLFSARSFFRDPVGYVDAQGEDGAALRLAAGPSRFLWARRVARQRLRAHYGAVPADVEEAFASGVAAWTLERHRARRLELAA